MPFAKEPNFRCTTSYDPKSKIWSGIKTAPLYGPESNLGGEVLKTLNKNPEKICQICHHNGRIYTNRDIAKLTVKIAQHFRNLRTSQDDVIGVVAGNTDYLAPLVFGAWLCGLIISAMEPNIDDEIIKQAYNITKPVMVFTIGSAYEKVKQSLNKLKQQATIYTLNEHMRGVPQISEFFKEIIDEETFVPEPLKYGCHQTAAFIRSSGSTGSPKVVCASHISLLNTYRSKCEPNDVFLGNTSIYWISGLNRLFGPCLLGVPRVINENGFQPASLPEVIEKYKISQIYAAPPSLVDLLAQQEDFNANAFSSVRSFNMGGCNVPQALIKKAKKLMPNATFHIVYGSSEANGSVSTGPCNDAYHSGQLVTNYEAKIIDDNGDSLGPGQTGEICVRNVFPWMGYFKNPQLTATIYKDGWLRTSDLGYFDEKGNLFVAERKNDIITYKLQRIYPHEIENILHELPGIVEVCVCGIPDDEAGQMPAVAVVKTKSCDLTAKEIYDYVAERVSDEMNLRGGIYFTNFIAKTATGKILRFRAGNFCENQRRMRLDIQNN